MRARVFLWRAGAVANHAVRTCINEAAASRTREIIWRQFKTRDRMGQQRAFGDGADAPVAIVERFQHPGIAGPGLEPEPGFERSDRPTHSTGRPWCTRMNATPPRFAVA